LRVVIIHKKFLELFDEFLAQLLYMVDMRVAVVRFLDGDTFQFDPFVLAPASRTSRAHCNSSARDMKFKMRSREMPACSAEAAANTINRN